MSRRGFSLIELLSVLAVMGILLGVISATLATLFRLDAAARQQVAIAETLADLDLQLRRDAHRATAAQFESDTLQLTAGERVYVWSSGDGAMTREVRQGDEVQARERWQLPAKYDTTWTVSENGDQLSLALEPQESSPARLGAPRQPIRVQTAIGTARRSEEQP